MNWTQVAYNSHKRAANATENGFFKKEIAPMEVRVKRETKVLDYDEGIRGRYHAGGLRKITTPPLAKRAS